MGLFSSLFGSSGSDKADKMRQSAIDAFNSVKTPALQDLQVQLDKEVSAGTLTPAQAEAQLLTSNAFNDIVTDPSLTGAAKQALIQLQQIGTQGGMTAIDKAQLQDITNQTNQLAKSRNASVLQNAQERGIGGSGLETANTLMSEQAAADRASQAGTDVAANAQQRALQAIQAAGGLGQSLEAQEYGEKAKKAETQNAIDLFNTQTANATNLYNTGTANQAQAENLANAQNIANTNTGISNTNKTYNAAQNQQVYNDELAKAQGIAGQYNNWANEASAAKTREQAADQALLGGALKAGGTAAGFAVGGPAGAAAANGVVSSNDQFGDVYSPTKKQMGYSEGGEVHPEENSAMSPEHAEPENRYSHECFGEFCSHPEHSDPIAPPLNQNQALTRTEAEPENKSLEDAYNDFIKSYCYGGTVKMANGGMVTIKPSNKPLNQEPIHTTPYHAEGYAEGGTIPLPSSTEAQNAADMKQLDMAFAQINNTLQPTEKPQIPEVSHPDEANDKTWAEKLGELLGSHATQAKEETHDFRSGGKVPGKAKVAGDSQKNHVVPAKLSPGEIVLPRTVVQQPNKIPNFIGKTLSKEDPTSLALQRLRKAHMNQGA